MLPQLLGGVGNEFDDSEVEKETPTKKKPLTERSRSYEETSRSHRKRSRSYEDGELDTDEEDERQKKRRRYYKKTTTRSETTTKEDVETTKNEERIQKKRQTVNLNDRNIFEFMRDPFAENLDISDPSEISSDEEFQIRPETVSPVENVQLPSTAQLMPVKIRNVGRKWGDETDDNINRVFSHDLDTRLGSENIYRADTNVEWTSTNANKTSTSHRNDLNATLTNRNINDIRSSVNVSSIAGDVNNPVAISRRDLNVTLADQNFDEMNNVVQNSMHVNSIFNISSIGRCGGDTTRVARSDAGSNTNATWIVREDVINTGLSVNNVNEKEAVDRNVNTFKGINQNVADVAEWVGTNTNEVEMVSRNVENSLGFACDRGNEFERVPRDDVNTEELINKNLNSMDCSRTILGNALQLSGLGSANDLLSDLVNTTQQLEESLLFRKETEMLSPLTNPGRMVNCNRFIPNCDETKRLQITLKEMNIEINDWNPFVVYQPPDQSQKLDELNLLLVNFENEQEIQSFRKSRGRDLPPARKEKTCEKLAATKPLHDLNQTYASSGSEIDSKFLGFIQRCVTWRRMAKGYDGLSSQTWFTIKEKVWGPLRKYDVEAWINEWLSGNNHETDEGYFKRAGHIADQIYLTLSDRKLVSDPSVKSQPFTGFFESSCSKTKFMLGRVGVKLYQQGVANKSSAFLLRWLIHEGIEDVTNIIDEEREGETENSKIQTRSATATAELTLVQQLLNAAYAITRAWDNCKPSGKTCKTFARAFWAYLLDESYLRLTNLDILMARFHNYSRLFWGIENLKHNEYPARIEEVPVPRTSDSWHLIGEAILVVKLIKTKIEDHDVSNFITLLSKIVEFVLIGTRVFKMSPWEDTKRQFQNSLEAEKCCGQILTRISCLYFGHNIANRGVLNGQVVPIQISPFPKTILFEADKICVNVNI